MKPSIYYAIQRWWTSTPRDKYSGMMTHIDHPSWTAAIDFISRWYKANETS